VQKTQHQSIKVDLKEKQIKHLMVLYLTRPGFT